MVFRKFLKQWFGYTRGERAGSFILLIILLIVLVIRALSSGGISSGRDEANADAVSAGFVIVDSGAAGISPVGFTVSDSTGAALSDTGGFNSGSLYLFDPNTASGDKLLGLGLSERQVRTIINYRSTGARFNEPEDFRKIYGIDREMQDRLLPFIIIGGESGQEHSGVLNGIKEKLVESGEYHSKGTLVKPDRNHGGSAEEKGAGTEVKPDRNHGGSAEEKGAGTEVKPDRNHGGSAEEKGAGTLVKLDLNHADSTDFEKLAGIGPVLAGRIVKYRKLLGNFSDPSQLSEVYGLSSDVIDLHYPRFTCDSLLVRKLNINRASYPDLLRHPYISRVQVEAITSYRRLSGSFTGMQELIVNRIFSRTEAERLSPYIEFE